VILSTAACNARRRTDGPSASVRPDHFPALLPSVSSAPWAGESCSQNWRAHRDHDDQWQAAAARIFNGYHIKNLRIMTSGTCQPAGAPRKFEEHRIFLRVFAH
jgi:hypothetical protein